MYAPRLISGRFSTASPRIAISSSERSAACPPRSTSFDRCTLLEGLPHESARGVAARQGFDRLADGRRPDALRGGRGTIHAREVAGWLSVARARRCVAKDRHDRRRDRLRELSVPAGEREEGFIRA